MRRYPYFFLLLFLPLVAQAQTMTVTNLNSTFSPVLKFGNGAYTYLSDPKSDQQTGTGGTGGDSDFVGGNGDVGGQPGFLMKFGTLTSGGPDYVMFRFRMDTWRSGGYNTNTMLGIDANGDGAIDLFFGVQKIGSSIQTVFQNPGTGLNISPNTTTLLSPYDNVTVSSTTFNYSDSTVLNGGADGSTANGTNDALLTFAITFSSLQAALAAVGIPGITDTTPLRWIGFTATQNNSINQDVYGIGKLSLDDDPTDAYPTNGDTPFLIFASAPTDIYGRVPEPATYGLIFMPLTALGIFAYRHRRKNVLAKG